jgi:hypothetical protein
MWVGGQRRFTPGKDTVSIANEAGWALGPVCKGAENLDPNNGIRFTDRPARSVYLYLLSYPGPYSRCNKGN